MTEKKFDYQSALEKIQKIVAEIEEGDPDIDQLAKKVKLASRLLKECRTKLRNTETTLDDILKTLDE